MGNIETDLIIKAIAKGFDQVSDDIEGLGKASEKADDGLQKASQSTGAFEVALGNLAAGALTAVGTKMLDFVKGSIEVASNAQETASLIENSLGPAAQGFTEDIAAMAEATNRSAIELEAGVSSIIAMTRSMGFGQQAAADFSVTMSQIAVDLGSFFNQSTEQVFLDLQSALAGSSETMLKYGIDVKETQLKNAALEMGLISQGETLDRVTRATVLQAEVLRQAADAMGDAERTSDSYENTQKGLQAAMLDLQVVIGESLLPVLTELAQEAIPAVRQAAEDAAPALQDMGEWLSKSLADVSTLNRVESLTRQIKEAGVSLENLGKISKPASMSFKEFVSALFDTEERVKQQRREIQLLELGFDALELGIDANSKAFVDYVITQDAAIERAKALNEANTELIDSEFNLEEAITSNKDAEEVAIETTTRYSDATFDLRDKKAQLATQIPIVVEELGNYYTETDKARGITKEMRDQVIGIKEDLFGVPAASEEASNAFGIAAGEMWVEANRLKTETELINQELDGIASFHEGEVRLVGIDEGLSKARELHNILLAIADEMPGEGGGSSGSSGGGSSGSGSGGSSGGGVGGGNIGPGFATGGSFIVPPGFPNDTFPMRVSSGEAVSVTPAGQSRGGNVTVNVIIDGARGSNPHVIARETAKKVSNVLGVRG